MKKVLILCVLAFSNVFAISTSVADIQVKSGKLDREKLSIFLESELQKTKTAQIIDRSSMKPLLNLLELCQKGISKCDESEIPELRKVDTIIFSEIQEQNGNFILNVRGVREKTWTVFYSNSFEGNKPETLLEDAVSELSLKFKLLASGEEKLDDSGELDGKYRLAILPVTMGNEEAQKLESGSIIDSILVSAIQKKGKFVIVENSRIKDLLNEKKITGMGFNSKPELEFESRGATHILLPKLKVYDGVYSLSYQIINVKSGNPIITDIIEWTEQKEIISTANAISESVEKEVFSNSGRLTIKSCNVDRVMIQIEDKQKNTPPEDAGFCPLVMESIPAGEYTLYFKNEERDTLVMDISIKIGQTTRLDAVQLPPIDMNLFYEANGLEPLGKYQEAMEKYREFYKKYPNHRMAGLAMYREGFILQVYLNRGEEGQRVLEDLIKRKPDAEIRSEAYFGMAIGYKKMGKEDPSIEIMNMLIQEYPASAAAEASRACLKEGVCSF